jgi:ATPase subunit of ABC transporter with duplicated ATPase domains
LAALLLLGCSAAWLLCCSEDAELRLVYGRRYGLVGPNGIGKTTLLKAIDDMTWRT